MDHSYNTDIIAKSYQDFLESEDGKIFREVIGNAFLSKISTTQSLKILDAGCGDGWLTTSLASDVAGLHTEVYACDAGAPLIESAKKQFPQVKFQVCDLNKPLPYEKDFFDVVTASMVIHDVEDELATLQNLATVLKPGGKLLATIVNPYYGYPIGEWKRGIIGRLLMKKPSLRLARFYNEMAQKNRPSFEWRPGLGSHFTPLSTHIANAIKAGFTLTGLDDISSTTDSSTYNLTYQLHRFPIILLLEFTKI